MDGKFVEIEADVGLEDSELMSYAYDKDSDFLLINVILWNSRRVEFRFGEFLVFIDKGCSEIGRIVERLGPSELMHESLRRNYPQEIPEDHPYRLFQILDIYDYPVIEVVSKSIEINKNF
jgi:hypothetical protein